MSGGPGSISPALLSIPFGKVRHPSDDVFLSVTGLGFLQSLFDGANDPAVAYVDVLKLRETGDSPVQWTPGLKGSTTAGTPTYVSAGTSGWTAKVGPLMFCAFSVQISAVGSIAGNVEITGFPFPANASGPAQAGTLSRYGGITLTSGYTHLGLEFPAGSAFANLIQSGSAETATLLQGSGLGAATLIVGSVLYFI